MCFLPLMAGGRRAVAVIGMLGLLGSLPGVLTAGQPDLAEPPPRVVAVTQPLDSAARWAFTAWELENGLRVIVQEDHRLPIAAVQVRYHVGSKDETPDRQGFAHMFEHMMFRGTERVKPEEHMEIIRLMGGSCNASTSNDRTEYHQTIPSEHIEKILWLEAERMVNLKVDQEAYDTERKVVIEEYRERVANRPTGRLYGDFCRQFFKVHPYRWTTIGEPEHLNAAKIEELQAFYKKYYQPNNAVLVIVGDVKVETMRPLVQKLFGGIARGPDIPRVTVREDANAAPTTIRLEAPVPVVGTGWAAPAVRDYTREAIALDFLADILGDDDIGRLALRLVHRDKIALGVQASNYTWEQAGAFIVGAGAAAGSDMAPLQKALDEEMDRLLQDGVTTEEVERVRTQSLRSMITDTLSIMNRASRLGEAACEYGDPNLVIARENWIKTLTVDEINAVARKYLAPTRRFPGTLTPPDTKKQAFAKPLPAVEGAIGGVPPPPAETAAAAPAALPRPEDFTLPNGLRVLFLQQTIAPMLTVQLTMPAGSQKDPLGKEGVANFVGELLLKGTAKRSAEELEKLLADRAIRLNAGSDRDDFSVRLSCLTVDKELAFELLSEVLFTPQFEAGAFQVAKDQRLSRLKFEQTNPPSLLDRYYYESLYGDMAYGRWWTVKSVEAIGREDLVKFHAGAFSPAGAVLAVVGDISRAELEGLLTRGLKDWKAAGPVANPGLDPVEAGRSRIVIVNKPGAAQSIVRAGRRSDLKRGERGFHMATVLAEIFGGGMSSRINKSLRVDGGLTYGAFGYFWRSRRGGDFRIGYSTKTESTGESLTRMQAVLKGALENAATEKELADTQGSLRGEFVLSLQEPRTLARLYAGMAMDGVGLDYYDQYLAAVADATVPELQAQAGKAMQDLVIVICGDAEKILPQVKDLNLPVDVLEPGKD